MAKKKKKFQETTIENYYDLKLDKIDELVAALKDESPAEKTEISYNVAEITGDDRAKNRNKEFDPYKVDKFSRIPAWVKALFIKFWFAGCACYFVMFGLKIDDLDKLVILGAVLGLIVDVLVNPLFRFMESDKKEYNAFMMFPFRFKAFWTFFTNLIYYIVVIICVNYCYVGLNNLINLISGTQNELKVGVEPLLFGVFAVIIDMIFIGIKDGIVILIKKRKNSKKEEGTLNV
ncbi:MAG: hypothetical protein K2H30_00095 [Clostridia bacterium]|nr:hypothetical protein [Clostridia bacterium]